MRIRKNRKLSSLLLGTAGYSGERRETYVCRLNQSPWDVIPLTSSGDAELTNLLDSSWFLPSSSSSSPPLIHQFNGEDRFNGNASLGDFNVAAERLNRSLGNNRSLVSVERLNLIAAANNYQRSPDVEEPMDRSDNSDKKSKALELNSPVKTSGDDDQVAVTMPAAPKRGRPRGTAKKALASTSASTNPYEFYYYSGFGPRWGRKRGGSGDEKIGMGDNEKSFENNTSKKSSSSSSSSDEEDDKTAAFGERSRSFNGFDYMGEDNGVESDKKKEKLLMMKKVKRGRKPVKERSLKSLM